MGCWICQGCEQSEHPQGLSLADPTSHATVDYTAEGKNEKSAQGIVATVKSNFVQDRLCKYIFVVF